MNFTPPFPKGLEQVLSQSIGGGGGECDGGGSNGEGGEGAGGGGLGGGSGGGEGEGGGGEGEGGEDGEGGPQQASLQFAESLFPLHNFVHFFLFFLHALFTLLLSFLVHVCLSVSASQFFGDGVGAVTLPLFISGAESIVRMSTTASGALNGATAQAHSRTQKAASHLSVPLSAVIFW